MTVLMDSDVAASVARARRRNAQAKGEADEGPDENRFEQESRAFFARVHDAYDRIAAREPERVFKVDARRRMDVVHRDIVEEVKKKFKI
jgi:dTMP kinase